MFHVSWLLLRSAPPQNPVAGPGGPPMWVWLSSHAVGIIFTLSQDHIVQLDFSADWVLFFFPQNFCSFIPTAKKKNQSWEKNLQYIVFATEKMIHWMWWIQNSFVFICFCDMAKYGSSKNLDLIRLDAIQLRKKPLYTCS